MHGLETIAKMNGSGMPPDAASNGELEAMLDRVAGSADRMRHDLAEYRALFLRLGCEKPGCCNAPSHVTQAQAARILGIGMPSVQARIKRGSLKVEEHYGTKMVPMASIIKVLDHGKHDPSMVPTKIQEPELKPECSCRCGGNLTESETGIWTCDACEWESRWPQVEDPNA